MSKLVDKEKLAKLAKALDDRAKAAVAAEQGRAMAAEQAIDAKADANAAAIEAINNAENGILAQAKAYAAAEDAKVAQAAADANDVLEGRIATLEGLVVGGEGEGLDAIIGDVAANTAAIAKLNGGEDEEGSVAKAVKAEKDRAEGIEADHEARIAANEAFVAAQPAIDAEQDRRLGVLEADAPVKQAAIEAAQAAAEAAQGAADAAQADVDAVEQRLDAEGGLVDRIEANEANIARLDGAVDVEGSVKKQIKDAIDAVNGVNEALDGRVEALEGRMQAAEAEEAQIRIDYAAADAQVLADAKAHAEQKITELVDSAPEAMNTLNELAKAINDNKGVYDAYIAEHATAMAQQKADLQAEIDADVKVVNDAFVAEKERVAEKEANFEGRIAANEAFVAAQPAVDAEQDRRLGVLEAAVGEGGATKEAIDAAQEAADAAQEAADNAQAAADAAQADADAIEERLDAEGGLVDRLEAAEAFVAAQPAVDEAQQEAIDDLAERMEAAEAFVDAHDHSVMEQGIADNKAAIEKEVEDRDAAIEAALEAYSTTEEMKAVIGNVVNSLALTMENDQVVLKLGGVDGIALTSVALDMATDEDIDAIINGLDAQPEA